MTFVSCSIPERFVNPLFEVFEGGDFVLSSYRDIEENFTRMRIFLPEPSAAADAERALKNALDIVGIEAPIECGEIPDEDWTLSYRRHFKTEQVSGRIWTVPVWEWKEEMGNGKWKIENGESSGAVFLKLDPGMAFGTGKHETTKACLQFIDELSQPSNSQTSQTSFLDMGTGSGILSIAAKKLGFGPVTAFDVDPEAVESARENAVKNGVEFELFQYGLGAKVKKELPKADLVVANILGPLLIRFADEIVPTVGRHLIISGILTELYDEVLATYVSRGMKELSRKTIGEWTTGLLRI